MAHMPLNHPLRPLYRILAGASGLGLLVVGLLAFGPADLPLTTAGAVLAVLFGVAALAGAVIGRNLGRWIHLISGGGLLLVGIASLALLRSEANLFGFSMTTCIVTFIVGLVLLTCGLYEQVGPAEKQQIEEQFRHGEVPDPEEHPLGADNVPRTKTEGA